MTRSRSRLESELVSPLKPDDYRVTLILKKKLRVVPKELNDIMVEVI